MDRDTYYCDKAYGGGNVTPRQYFRNKDIADAYQKACDELWDYSGVKYKWVKGKGFVKNKALCLKVYNCHIFNSLRSKTE